MLYNTVTLMNTYLKTLNYIKINYFYEKDFVRMSAPSLYFRGCCSSCNKYQTIIYDKQIFHIGIKCIVDERLDKIIQISFYSKDINKAIFECINDLLVQFSSFVNNNLYQTLMQRSSIKLLYQETIQKLQHDHQRLRTNKLLDTNNMFLVNPSIMKDLPYHIYIIIYIYEEKILNISFLFDLYHQL